VLAPVIKELTTAKKSPNRKVFQKGLRKDKIFFKKEKSSEDKETPMFTGYSYLISLAS
jgi:hypothetical protein